MSKKYRDPGMRAVLAKIRHFTVLADHFGLSRQTVWAWEQIPAEKVLDVEALSGVPRHVIRPDLYPVDREIHPEMTAA